MGNLLVWPPRRKKKIILQQGRNAERELVLGHFQLSGDVDVADLSGVLARGF